MVQNLQQNNFPQITGANGNSSSCNFPPAFPTKAEYAASAWGVLMHRLPCTRRGPCSSAYSESIAAGVLSICRFSRPVTKDASREHKATVMETSNFDYEAKCHNVPSPI